MRDAYDVIVIGAGPAGSMAAHAAALRGASVLLVEKRPAIGAP
ncbi:MAG TPA: FAD-dependent oxidoreductase, partial [Methanocorpusculum sp.]|nr:FAD-dependent oxidoreductase [Methanocorpusculum sp.]